MTLREFISTKKSISKKEADRLISSGGVYINEIRETRPTLEAPLSGIIRVGKREIYDITGDTDNIEIKRLLYYSDISKDIFYTCVAWIMQSPNLQEKHVCSFMVGLLCEDNWERKQGRPTIIDWDKLEKFIENMTQ